MDLSGFRDTDTFLSQYGKDFTLIHIHQRSPIVCNRTGRPVFRRVFIIIIYIICSPPKHITGDCIRVCQIFFGVLIRKAGLNFCRTFVRKWVIH